MHQNAQLNDKARFIHPLRDVTMKTDGIKRTFSINVPLFLLRSHLIQCTVNLFLDGVSGTSVRCAMRKREAIKRLPRRAHALNDTLLDVGAHPRQALRQLCNSTMYDIT